MTNNKLNKIKMQHKVKADMTNIPFVYSDVDETLVCWPDDPFTETNESVQIELDGTRYYLNPHVYNIEQLKKLKRTGFKVVVWSLGGQQWAQNAVNALELNEYVDFVLAKPDFIIDDLPPSEWMGANIYKPFPK